MDTIGFAWFQAQLQIVRLKTGKVTAIVFGNVFSRLRILIFRRNLAGWKIRAVGGEILRCVQCPVIYAKIRLFDVVNIL